jgi:hypothetical protein
VQENEKREYGDAFFSTDMWAKFKFEERLQKVETWNELLQHSYSLSSLRDFKKNLEVL